MFYTLIVRPDAAGRFTASVYGIPEVRAEADTEAEAIRSAQQQLTAWLTSARLVAVSVPQPACEFPAPAGPAPAQTDAELAEYQEDIRRFREEVDKRECSNSSSTPTT